MAKLKGIEKVEKIVSGFAGQFGVTARFDTEFEAFCDNGRRIVGYTFLINEGGCGHFVEDAIKRYPDVEADLFLWALMHEIGHCMTESMWTPEEREYFYYQKDMIADSEVEVEHMNAWYHACPDEFMATKWAGDFMRNHPKQMKKFWKKFKKALMYFYKENGLI